LEKGEHRTPNIEHRTKDKFFTSIFGVRCWMFGVPGFRPPASHMIFPVVFKLFGLPLHAHLVAEVIAYTGGFQLFLRIRKKFPQANVPVEKMMWIIVGAVFGALFGSKLLAWAESPENYITALQQGRLDVLMGGKTVVGGLLGGWAGVELAKRLMGVGQSTGDAFAFPLIFGQCAGRVGCFLTGLADHTHGVHSSLPWAVDFGDGPRHPTQLYEIAFLLVLAVVLWRVKTTMPLANGSLFKLYLVAYLLFRFAVEFIKPVERGYAGLSAIQWASLAGAIVLVALLVRLRRGLKGQSITNE
jgi:phosphatidylglycerol:prolipoprotein diacylglycerol transferase